MRSRKRITIVTAAVLMFGLAGTITASPASATIQECVDYLASKGHTGSEVRGACLTGSAIGGGTGADHKQRCRTRLMALGVSPTHARVACDLA